MKGKQLEKIHITARCGHAAERTIRYNTAAQRARAIRGWHAAACPACRERERVEEREAEFRKTIDAGKRAQRWSAGGTVRQQAGRLERRLRAVSINYDRVDALSGSIYFELANGRKLRVADHGQPVGGGFKADGESGTERWGKPTIRLIRKQVSLGERLPKARRTMGKNTPNRLTAKEAESIANAIKTAYGLPPGYRIEVEVEDDPVCEGHWVIIDSLDNEEVVRPMSISEFNEYMNGWILHAKETIET